MKKKTARLTLEKKKSAKLTVEAQEDRNLLANFGMAWPNAEHITLSFARDGTGVDGYQSSLFQSLNAQVSTKAWEMEVLRALQTWAVNSNINIGIVADGGQALGSAGSLQGDTRFGDIRLAARAMGTTDAPLAIGSPYDPLAGTRAGDI